ncbi:hypothetical protein PHYSODRAFT_498132 [Phytophthora sojae]|uniref:Uncharacterized protein n=1 Tax=Phytophthora sojae (strain P6497) TaxID=1094619 RepID=G4ZIF8_PHYSP|nr:hypothetical protein PHYSODRAFT_498132 [Phytophthora sojae]EGZ16822.1 hypothetical protein PHYSODRAFT_498132 [Phytophthora sojae]|eukprot:XP_009525880.1 hypothetical protein PHYSODRAFT_498132 [Phytophthora sojae]
MALDARIKTKGEFHVSTDRGPPLVDLSLSVGDQPPRQLGIEGGPFARCGECIFLPEVAGL